MLVHAVAAGVSVGAAAVLCLGLCLRLQREGSRIVAGTVNLVCAVICQNLCRCFGPCHGYAVARSRVGKSRVGALCRRAVVVTAVRCGAAAVCLVRSRAVADCGCLSQKVNVLMLRVVVCVLLLSCVDRVGVPTLFGRTSWWSRVESSGVE